MIPAKMPKAPNAGIQIEPKPADINTGFGGVCGLVDLKTTIAGFEMTLETLVEISGLLKRLDDRLAQLSPNLPQIGKVASGSQSLSGSFGDMLAAYQDAFSAMARAAQSAALLGLITEKPVVLTLEVPEAQPDPLAAAPMQDAPKPAEPVAEQPTPEPVVEKAPESPKAHPPAVNAGPAEPRKPVSGKANLEPVSAAASQRFSYNAPTGRILKEAAEIIKPLKPIEMPSVDNQVGPMITAGQSVIYAHGTELKKHWPGQRDFKAALESPVPNDPWRLLAFEANLFCVRDDGVTVLGLGELHKEGSFQGTFVAQTHTASCWVGVQNDNGDLSVVFRDKGGRPSSDPAKLGNFFDAKVFVATAGEAAFVALGSGELFRIEGSSATALPKADKRGTITGLSVDSRGLLLTNQGPHGVVLSLLDRDGNLLGESAVVAQSISHSPVLLDDMLYLFDDQRSEVVTLAFDSLDELQRKSVEGIKGVVRLLALKEDSGVTVAILAGDIEGRPSDVFLHSVESGTNTKLCHLSALKGEIAYAEGHIVVSSTSSMQNMVQIFSVYGPVPVARAA
jgi:hypothetical protein